MKYRIVADSSSNILRMDNPHYASVPMKVRADREYVDDLDLNLAEICIVSSCDWEAAPEGATAGVGANLPQLTVGVSEAKGEKCPRCWMHSEKADAEGLCPRCAGVIAKLDIEI